MQHDVNDPVRYLPHRTQCAVRSKPAKPYVNDVWERAALVVTWIIFGSAVLGGLALLLIFS